MFTDSLKKRRSVYNINKELPITREELENTIDEITRLVPDAFNMKSARVYFVMGKEHEQLWEEVYSIFEGKVDIEKINSFKNGAGTILYFYDSAVVEGLEEKFPLYAANFKIWANHGNAMLQFSIWSALAEMGIGANLQHYNPIIDEKVKELFKIPKEYTMVAQMPFGGIVNMPDPKEEESFKRFIAL
ncbi:MAG: nitroreductase family protein [Filifactoraceae bacterium]